MKINRFTKIAFSLAFVITAQPFFCMESRPAMGAAVPLYKIYRHIDFFDPKIIAAILAANDLTSAAQAVGMESKPAAYIAATATAAMAGHEATAFELELIKACLMGTLQDVLLLFKNHPEMDINARDLNGATALMYAAANGKLDIVEYLVRHDARINVSDNYGDTPFSWASVWEKLPVMAYLYEHGACIDTRDDKGQTPLIKTASHQWTGIDSIKFLIKHGADIYHRDKDGFMAIEYARAAQKQKTAHYLMQVMLQKSILYTLLACNDILETEDCPFPPELIDRVLKPVTAAALSRQ